MRRSRWLRYALLCGLVGISVSVFINLVFPVILGSRLLFGGLVALLLVGGLVSGVIAARGVFRR